MWNKVIDSYFHIPGKVTPINIGIDANARRWPVPDSRWANARFFIELDLRRLRWDRYCEPKRSFAARSLSPSVPYRSVRIVEAVLDWASAKSPRFGIRAR